MVRFKNRQQEVQPVLVGWCHIGDYFVPFEIQCRYHIPLSKLVSGSTMAGAVRVCVPIENALGDYAPVQGII